MTNRAPPPIVLDEALRPLLKGGQRATDLAELAGASARPCVYVRSERVSSSPLRRGAIASLLRRPIAPATLSPLASKFGGAPYVDQTDVDWSAHAFLGQVNLAELAGLLPGWPARGILALDLDRSGMLGDGLRVRFYSDPSASAARDTGPVVSVGAWETRLVFTAGWSLPHSAAWRALLIDPDPTLEAAWAEFGDTLPGYHPPSDAEHILGGYLPIDPQEVYSVADAPAAALVEPLWRVTYDNAADFGWGSNWLYALIEGPDLAAGRLERAFGGAANG